MKPLLFTSTVMMLLLSTLNLTHAQPQPKVQARPLISIHQFPASEKNSGIIQVAEVCIDGTVYLVTNSGGITIKSRDVGQGHVFRVPC